MIDEYIEWGGKIVYGETHQMLYSDVLEFVNFRIETADTILLLIERHKSQMPSGSAALCWSTTCCSC